MSEYSSEVKYGGIAFVDVLGVKGIWARETPDSVIRKWKQTVSDFNDITKAIEGEGLGRVRPKVRSFSDTIILTHESENPLEILGYMSLHLTYPFCHSLLQRIFLRGVISIGNYYESDSDSMVIGPAVDEAANWYERSDWFGISLAPSASFLLQKNVETGGNAGWWIKYDIPNKTGVHDNSWALNWPPRLQGVMSMIPDTRNPTEAIYDAFSIPPIGPEVVSKYENTITFYKKMLEA